MLPKAFDEITLAADAHMYIVDDDGLVFSESSQEIFALNTAATFIWCCAEERMPVPRIVGRLAHDFGTPPAQAGEQVAALLSHWRRLGLIEGGDGDRTRVPARKADEIPQTPADMPPWERSRVVAEHRYRMLTTTVAVRFTTTEQEAWVHPVLAHLETGETGRAASVIDVIAADGQHLIYSDGEPRARGDGLEALAPWVKSLLWETAINNHDYFLEIHAGVVGAGDRCILLPGAPGNGKSTLTSALIHAGFTYFSDEVALLEDRGFAVRPLPLSIGIKSTGWDVLASYFPELRDLPIHHRIDGRFLRYLPPPASAIPAEAEAAHPVGYIIFPRYAPTAETRLEPLGRVAALHRLMEECLAIPGPLTVENVAGLAQWIKSVDCYELPLSSLESAVELVVGITGPPDTA